MKERRIYQIIYGKVSEYGTLMSEWHIAIYTGRDLPPQSANHTPNSNRSSRVLHLKAVGAQGKQAKEIIASVKVEEKNNKLRSDKST